MRVLLSIILIFGYVLAANLFFVRASRFARDPGRTILRHQVWRASTYTAEGQPYRLAAIRFAIIGAVGLAAAIWFISR